MHAREEPIFQKPRENIYDIVKSQLLVVLLWEINRNVSKKLQVPRLDFSKN